MLRHSAMTHIPSSIYCRHTIYSPHTAIITGGLMTLHCENINYSCSFQSHPSDILATLTSFMNSWIHHMNSFIYLLISLQAMLFPNVQVFALSAALTRRCFTTSRVGTVSGSRFRSSVRARLEPVWLFLLQLRGSTGSHGSERRSRVRSQAC